MNGAQDRPKSKANNQNFLDNFDNIFKAKAREEAPTKTESKEKESNEDNSKD